MNIMNNNVKQCMNIMKSCLGTCSKRGSNEENNEQSQNFEGKTQTF